MATSKIHPIHSTHDSKVYLHLSNSLRVAWRHVIGNLIKYFEQHESMQKAQSKEFSKLSRMLEVPFKVPFTSPDFAPDGIALIWQGMRDKAVQMSTFHNEEANLINVAIVTDLSRLSDDIKNHLKDIDNNGLQGSKKVGKNMDQFVRPS
jgi:hypothetical protein